MNFLLLYPSECCGTSAVVTGQRAAELMEMHHLIPGIDVAGGVIDGKLGSVHVSNCSDTEIQLSINFERLPPPKNGLSLIIATPRPPTVKKILHLAAMTGVEEVHFIRTENVVPSYLQTKMLASPNIEKDLVFGLSQAGDTVLPKVYIHPKFHSFLENAVPDLPQCRLVADLAGGVFDSQAMMSPAALAFGPESGWTENELKCLKSQWFSAVSLGPRMLRVEVAVGLFVGALTVPIRPL